MKQIARPYLRLLLLTTLVASAAPVMRAAGDGCNTTANLTVQCSRTSSFVRINLSGCRKIGKVTLEVRDQQGRTLYREEGKALTGELVRNLDKGTFPRGTHELFVVGKDLTVSQRFTVE